MFVVLSLLDLSTGLLFLLLELEHFGLVSLLPLQLDSFCLGSFSIGLGSLSLGLGGLCLGFVGFSLLNLFPRLLGVRLQLQYFLLQGCSCSGLRRLGTSLLLLILPLTWFLGSGLAGRVRSRRLIIRLLLVESLSLRSG